MQLKLKLKRLARRQKKLSRSTKQRLSRESRMQKLRERLKRKLRRHSTAF